MSDCLIYIKHVLSASLCGTIYITQNPYYNAISCYNCCISLGQIANILQRSYFKQGWLPKSEEALEEWSKLFTFLSF